MNDILKYIGKFFTNFINNENYINLINMIVVAVTTYLVTKYTTLKPNRLAIKRSQLDNVYLPLHLVFMDMPQLISRSDALNYSKKISNILDAHYILAFPQLHKLNQVLKEKIISGSGYEKTLGIIKHQVDIDFELLKKTLGYPSENLFVTFRRMTLKQKLNCIFPWIDASWVFISYSMTFILKDFLGGYTILALIVLLLIGVLVLCVIKIFTDSLKY